MSANPSENQTASFTVRSQGSTYMPCCFFSQGFQLRSVAPTAWKNVLPLVPILWPLDLVSSVSPAPWFVSLHNWHVDSCFRSMVTIPAALPSGTPVVLSSLSVPKVLAAPAWLAAFKAAPPCSLLFLIKMTRAALKQIDSWQKQECRLD